jgi:hypothetical protein
MWNILSWLYAIKSKGRFWNRLSLTTIKDCGKLANPTPWVVLINWNEHTRKLQDIYKATLIFDSLVEFLCSAVFPESKYKNTSSSLLKQALKYCGNVTVLMCGFDEISHSICNKLLPFSLNS